MINKMDTIHFLVKGSVDVPYKVTFQKDGNIFSAFCTCAAGQNGQFCKHRFSILEQITNGIVSENVDQVSVVAGWLGGTLAASALEAVNTAELELERAKTALISAKKKLATTMRA
jgi:uncharacterized Zn finger protein